jgi:hypothetical protein
MSAGSIDSLGSRFLPFRIIRLELVAQIFPRWNPLTSWIRQIEDFQRASSLNESMTREVIEKSIGLLEKKCIRLNGHEPNWRALFSEQLEELARSKSPADFELLVNKVMARGGLSHVAFFHGSAQRAPARYAVNATFCAFDTPNGARWMFEDVHEGGPAHAAGIRAGDILLEANGRAIQPPELPTFALGTDHAVTVESADQSVRQVQLVLPKGEADGKARAKPPMAEPASVTSRMLEPGIGYVRIAFFPGINGQRFARELDRALSPLDGCNRCRRSRNDVASCRHDRLRRYRRGDELPKLDKAVWHICRSVATRLSHSSTWFRMERVFPDTSFDVEIVFI